MDALWFIFFFGLQILKTVLFLFCFVSDYGNKYGNESETKENKN